jgi:Sulfatase-modifying factor enzyme 1
VAEIASARSMSLAAVSVTGTFRDVSGTIAYNRRTEGTPLTQPGVDVTQYLLPFQAPVSAEWRFAGFYAATAEGQSLLSVPGRSLHLRGFRSDRTLGGRLNAATITEAMASLHPPLRGGYPASGAAPPAVRPDRKRSAPLGRHAPVLGDECRRQYGRASFRPRRGREPDSLPTTASEARHPQAVQRGGSFLCCDQYCSRYIVAARGKGAVDSGTSHVGFRSVRSGG